MNKYTNKLNTNMSLMSFEDLNNYMIYLYPKMNNVYKYEPVSLPNNDDMAESNSYDSGDETYNSETDDSIYFSDNNSDLFDVLEDFMNISNVSDDSNFSFKTTNNVSKNCDKCKEVFNMMHAYDIHMVNEHVGDLFYCEYCGEGLSVSYYMNQHIVNNKYCLIHKKNRWGMFLVGGSGFVFPTPVELPSIEKPQKIIKNQNHKKMLLDTIHKENYKYNKN